MASRKIRALKIVASIFAVILLGSALFVYYNHLALKKTLISKIAYKASSMIGQEVKIGDISVSAHGQMSLRDIIVENPEGFGKGRLLKIKKLSWTMELNELLNKKVHLKKIEIDSPELSLIKDEKGRFNISETLRLFFSRKGIEYRIDELKIVSGVVYLNEEQKLRSGDITLTLKNLSSDPGTKTLINLKAVSLGKSRVSADGWAYLKDDPKKFGLSAAMEKVDTLALTEFSLIAPGFSGMHYGLSGDIVIPSLEGALDSSGSIRGSASVRMKSLSVINMSNNKALLRNAQMDSDVSLKGKNLDFTVNTRAKNLSAKTSGTVNDIAGEGRSVTMKTSLPETKAAEIRDALWDIFPDKLLYVGLGGTVACDLSLRYASKKWNAEGKLRLKGLTLEGENKEYYIGPVNGALPLHYVQGGKKPEAFTMPSFDSGEFENLRRYYAEKKETGLAAIRIGALRYGFRLLEDIELSVVQGNERLNVARFSANIFGGRLNGSAVADISGEGVDYRAGFIAKGISLTKLCEEIAPIKGYITGKVDGIALLRGSGAGMERLLGKADFWSYSAEGEKTTISREFLEKVGGPSMKPYLRERSFDKGIVSLYIQNGFLIFKELEISNRNIFGMKDLSVKVAPYNNRIAIDHLMSSIAEAAQRSKEK